MALERGGGEVGRGRVEVEGARARLPALLRFTIPCRRKETRCWRSAAH